MKYIHDHKREKYLTRLCMFSLIGNITQACCHLLWDRCKLSIVEKINNSCFCLSCGPSSLPTCDLLAPSLVFHTIACSHVSDHWPFIADAFFISQKNQHSEQYYSQIQEGHFFLLHSTTKTYPTSRWQTNTQNSRSTYKKLW